MRVADEQEAVAAAATERQPDEDIPGSLPDNAKLLRRVSEQSQTLLAHDNRAQTFLRNNGITDQEVWRHFRVGSDDAELWAGLSDGERDRFEALLPASRRLALGARGRGMLLPTCDPRDWEQPLGLIRVMYAQRQHAFLTAPRGIACEADATTQERLVLTDTPLAGLRLAQAGVRGVCVVDAPRVLPPLRDFLRERQVVLLSCKQPGLAALAEALDPVKAASQAIIGGNLERCRGALSAVGITVAKPAPARQRLTQRQVAELVRYAQERLAAGEGLELLRAHGADQGELNAVLQMGFLPPGFRGCLDRDSRLAWEGHAIGNRILVPALDEGGAVIDFCAVGANRATPSVYDHPQGLIGARVAAAYETLLVTDSLRLLARLFREEHRNVLLLRGPEDAAQNARRLYTLGVREATIICHSEADQVAAALRQGGITATRVPRSQAMGKHRDAATPAPAAAENHDVASADNATLKLARYDPEAEQASFTAGAVTYSAEVTRDGSSRLTLRVEREQAVHVDRFDLASDAQRRRFAMSAALKVQRPFEQIEADLIAILCQIERLRAQRQQQATASREAVALTAAEREAALAELKRPELLERIAADLEALGWVGEETAKRLLYLTAVSRKLHHPLSAVRVAASGAGKSYGLELVAELTPPEDLLHLSRLTDAALYYHDQDGLRHKLLLIDEAAALTPEALAALRVLQSRGTLSQAYVLRDAHGDNVTRSVQAQGPVAVFTSTTGKLDEQNLSRCFAVPVDESAAQTRRVLEAQRRLRADPDAAGGRRRRAAIVKRHHDMQRLLECRGVRIPFAGQITFPAQTIKHRREQERFLNLIEASALLHQHQRQVQRLAQDEECIIAELRDFESARQLASDSIVRAGDDFSQNARDVLLVVAGSKLATFSLNDLRALRPEWTRHKFRMGLAELVQLEILLSPQGGRGRVRQYVVHAGTAPALRGCSVRLEESGGLAGVGDAGLANAMPALAGG